MGQYKNERGEISQIIEEHINLMIGRYLETGDVFKCISAKIGFFPYAQCLGKVMLEALAVGNMKTLDLLVPYKTEPVTHIFPAYRPAADMLIGLWRKDNSVLDYAIPRAKK